MHRLRREHTFGGEGARRTPEEPSKALALLGLQQAAGNAAVSRMIGRRTLQRRYKLHEEEGEDAFTYGWINADGEKPQGHYQWAGTFAELGDLLWHHENQQWVRTPNMFGMRPGTVWHPNPAPFSTDHEIVRQAKENLGAYMTRREPAPTGDIGRMDFRFEPAVGVLYYVDLPPDYRPQPGVQMIAVDAGTLRSRIAEAEVGRYPPRTGEAVANRYLYVRRPADRTGDDMKPREQRNRIVFPGGVHSVEDFRGPGSEQLYQRLAAAADKVDQLIPLTRLVEVTYTGEARGESRDTGQVSKMAGMNAAAYALARGLPNAMTTPWEWLHIRGARLGGATSAANLVPGTSATNSHMIPYESRILELSRRADAEHPLYVRFSVETFRARFATKIWIEYAAPKGLNGIYLTPEQRQGAHSFDPINGQIIDRTSRDLMWRPPVTQLPPTFPWPQQGSLESATAASAQATNDPMDVEY